MDAAALRQLALEVSSGDLAVSGDAKRNLQAFFTPTRAAELMADPAAAEELSTLLKDVEAAEDRDIYTLIGSALRDVFTDLTDARRGVLFAPSSHFLLEFVVRSAAAADTAVASTMLAALQCIVLDTLRHAENAVLVGQLLDAHFHNDRVLRLLNCDDAEAPTNPKVCAFLEQHTALLHFLLEATEGAFASDPLLLANYLVASGVVCRTVAMPSTLRQATMQVLQGHDDPVYYAFVCRFWSIALLRHEDNGSRDAAACVSAVVPVVASDAQDEAATEAAFDVLGAAATTQTGWDAVTSLLRCDELQARLRSTSSSLRLSTLNLILSMLGSSHVVPSYFTKDLMLDAWQTRTTPDDEVRLALWRVVLKALRFDGLEKVLAAVCASFLCSGAYEENITVRTMKLQAADYLVQHSTLPENVQTRLKQYIDRGLYPAGSSGVSLLTKE
ncbi:hypothetical protein ABB37_06502 [Leptomonas pyrrhocoris]|uniref:Uncharacterized protein n=1 Tax=Leptomonas pyrrhocoris TaxID=157538 RepID=A0A0N0DU40_LEPPY|nr:hypothetical protein ABB37_06502 [Leptomonas pyrrhocoris]KPA78392.1 hypothetical protein ABB37_06502 [Leptomonas pyrrhocoris]|eukprot:XP_015656831.1 hypothetical protein ABB37_06502 [Leptomonas pyrrhocoris]